MNHSIFIGLVNNAALLLALWLLYDMLPLRSEAGRGFQKIFTGFIVGAIGIAIMLNPWDFGRGVVFDMRSVLLCIAGFFFGAVPALLAMTMTGAYRLFTGGTGAWTGVAVIVTSGVLGLVWRHFRSDKKKDPTAAELYLLGLVVHGAMLAWMLSLPAKIAFDVLARISVPVMLIYPPITAVLGTLMVNRRRRKLAEEDIASNYALLRIAGKTARFGGWNVDLRTNTCKWSDTVADIHEMPRGYSPQVEDGIGFYAPEWQEKITRVFTDCAEKGISYNEEMEIITKGGKRVWVRTAGEAVRDDQGNIIQVQGSFQDITERKQAEKTLRENEQLHKEAQRVAKIGHWELDPKIGTPKWSEQVFYIFGLDPQGGEPSFIDHRKHVHPEDWDILNDAVSRAAREGIPFDIQFRIQRSDRAEKWLHAMGTATKDDEGKVQKIFGTVQDVTERKRAEEELRRRERQLHQIFELLPIGLWFADKDGTLLRGNPAGVKIWGAEPHVPISEYGVFKARRLPSGEPVRADDWALAKTIREGATIVDELLEIEAFDGRKKTILNYTAPVMDKEGIVEGAIVVNLDISERMALEAQLRQAQKLESVGRLAGGVAHDYNNMLSVILGCTEMALERVDPGDPLHEDLEEILAAAKHSADITRQLLAFARQQTVSPSVLDLNESIEAMLKMLRRLIGEDIDLLWKPGKVIWPVKMDPAQLDQILANLCVNARDAIARMGKITIETATAVFDEEYCAEHAGFLPGQYTMLAVSDDGCGMDQETQAYLFEPFFTTKKSGEGTGLGLATIYGIVRQNRGFINVYSEPKAGATFRIYLPRHTAGKQLNKDTDVSEAFSSRGETVLLVEDEPSILKIGQKMLESLGYDVLAAGAPEQALALTEEHAGGIDLVITDVVMPKMNGQELVERLREFSPNLKAVFMSGYPSDAIAHQGVLDDGIHFMQKPFSRKQLAEKVREALGH